MSNSFDRISRILFVYFILFSFFGVYSNCYSQSYFSKRYDFLCNSTQSFSGDIIIYNTGYVFINEAISDATGFRHFGFILIDSLGNRICNDILYENSVMGLTTGYPGSFIRSSDNQGFSLVGFSYLWVPEGRWDRGMLWRFNNILDTLWTKSFSDAPAHDTSFLFRNFRELPDKGYIIVGSHGLVNGTGKIRINLHRIDSLGNLLWRKYYGSGNIHFLPSDVSLTSDDGYLIGAGRYPVDANNSQDNDPYIIKTDAMGNMQWSRQLGNPDCRDDCVMADQALDGNIICGTTFSDTCWGSGECLSLINFVKITNNNVIIWDKKYGVRKHFLSLNKIRVLPDGSIIATGKHDYSNGYTRNDVGWILKTDSAGNEEWYREYQLLYASKSNNTLYNVIPTPDNGYIACGTVWPYPPDTGTQDSWVLRVDSLGCEAPEQCWVGQEEIFVKNFTPEKPFVVYPNPATDKLTVEFHINPAGADIDLLNIPGQIVLSTRISPNRDIIELDIGHLKGGMYLLKVTIPGRRPVVEKVIVKKCQ